MSNDKVTISVEELNNMINKGMDQAIDKMKQKEEEKRAVGRIALLIIMVLLCIFFIGVVIYFGHMSYYGRYSNYTDHYQYISDCDDQKMACVPMPILFFDLHTPFYGNRNEATHCCIPVCEKAYVEDTHMQWVRACTDTGYAHFRFNRTMYENMYPPSASVKLVLNIDDEPHDEL